MSDPRATFGSILRDDLGLCSGTYMTLEVSCLADTWDGTWDLARESMWSYLDIFLEPEEVATLRRQAKAMRGFWKDLAKLSGEPVLLSEPIIRELERRMVTAARPSGYRVALAARKGKPAIAAASVKRLLTEESWRKRF